MKMYPYQQIVFVQKGDFNSLISPRSNEYQA